MRYPDQGTFHPLKYLRAVAQAILDKGGLILANSPIVKIDELKHGVRVVTESGASVAADRAIFATNVPINDRVEIHSKMAPYRTYAMAFTILRDSLPDALYWDMADPYHYVRLNPGPGAIDYLIAGGEDHKSGEADDGGRRFAAIEAWIRKLVPTLGNEVHRWSGQVMTTIDHCGFIGRNPGSDRVFVATGDSGQGITHGALAGILLKDLIVAGSSPWKETYDPSRKTAKGIVNYVSENVTALKNFAEYLLPGGLDSTEQLQAGAGRDPARGASSAGRLPRHGRQAACSFGHLHASRLSRELELDGAVLGLPLPRLAVRAGRYGPEWSGDFPARGRQGAGGQATCMTLPQGRQPARS